MLEKLAPTSAQRSSTHLAYIIRPKRRGPLNVSPRSAVLLDMQPNNQVSVFFNRRDRTYTIVSDRGFPLIDPRTGWAWEFTSLRAARHQAYAMKVSTMRVAPLETV